MNAVGIVLIVIVVIVVIALLWAVGAYNAFVRLRNLVQEAWRQIDVELTRRHDLIPNLVETVKGYAAHERGVFDEVAQARSLASAPASGPAEQAAHENQLTQALGKLFAVAEAYPVLRASENFQQLQSELTNTEDRIAAGADATTMTISAPLSRCVSCTSIIVRASDSPAQRASTRHVIPPGT